MDQNTPNRIRELRKKRNMSGVKLAEMLGISPQYLYDLEKGERRLNEELIKNLSRIFNVPTDYLLSHTENPFERLPPQAVPVDKSKLKPVPIYGRIRAGEPMFVNEEILGYDYVLESEMRNSDYFFLLVQGDSMINARISEGDLVLIKKQNWLENGDIGVIMIGGEEATIKRYYEHNGLVILKPENPAYSPQVYKPEEVTILGRVAEIRIKR